MRVLKANINGVWTPINVTNSFVSGIYYGLPNLQSIAGNGEIAMNIFDNGRPSGFALQLTSNGTYYIDWGDGTIDMGTATAYTTQTAANGLTAQVSHTYNNSNSSGRGIWIDDLKGYVYTVRIYNASSPIKYFKVARVLPQYNEQHNGVIEAYLNLTTLVDISQMWSSGVSINPVISSKLRKVTLVNSDLVLKSDYFAYKCVDFEYYNFPSSPLLNSRSYAYDGTAIETVVIGSLYSGASTGSLFHFLGGSHITKASFTVDWGSISDCSYMFYQCTELYNVSLPIGIGNNKLTNCDNLFNGCYNLISLTGVENLGSTTSNCSMNGTFDGLECYTGGLVINAKLTKFTCKGSSSYLNGVTSIRLLNSNSPFTGTSSQIDVSYCNLSASALNQLFTDIPAISGKTIKITGCPGAATCNQSIATSKGWIVSN